MSNDTTDFAAASLAVDDALVLEQLCMEFQVALENATRNGAAAPDVEAYQAQVPPALRDQLAGLLTRLQREHQIANSIPDLSGLLRYELGEVLTNRPMSVVFRAQERATGEAVVVKVLRAGELDREPRQEALWCAERDVVAGLNHPNVVPVKEIGSHNGHVYLVMPYIAGGDLDKRKTNFALDGATDRADAAARQIAIARIMRQVADAVDHVHRAAVIHRDLKPSNILIDENGIARVCDFGLARRLNESLRLTLTGQVLGTVLYMPPEQARGERVLTVAVDIWSIGAVLYELLTGDPPFCEGGRPYPSAEVLIARKSQEGATPLPPSEANRTVPIHSDLEWICMRCLEHDPCERFASAAELAEALRKFLDGEPVQPQPSVGEWVRGSVKALTEHVNRSPAQPDYIRRWWLALQVEACTSAIAHGTLFVLVQSGAAAPWVWLAYLAGDVVMGWTIWQLAMRRAHLTGMERSLRQMWLGFDFTSALLFAVTVPLTRPPDVTSIATFYTAYLMLRGLVFFIEGRMCWGRLYYVSGAFYAAAIAVQFVPSAPAYAPLLYAGVYSTWFVWLSFCQWDRQRKTEPAGPGGLR